MSKAPTPTQKVRIDLKNLQVPRIRRKRRQFFSTLTEDQIDQIFDAVKEVRSKLNDFLVQEGAVAGFISDARAKGGLTLPNKPLLTRPSIRSRSRSFPLRANSTTELPG